MTMLRRCWWSERVCVWGGASLETVGNWAKAKIHCISELLCSCTFYTNEHGVDRDGLFCLDFLGLKAAFIIVCIGSPVNVSCIEGIICSLLALCNIRHSRNNNCIGNLLFQATLVQKA